MWFCSHINTQSIRINIKIFKSKLSISSLPFPTYPSKTWVRKSKTAARIFCFYWSHHQTHPSPNPHQVGRESICQSWIIITSLTTTIPPLWSIFNLILSKTLDQEKSESSLDHQLTTTIPSTLIKILNQPHEELEENLDRIMTKIKLGNDRMVLKIMPFKILKNK